MIRLEPGESEEVGRMLGLSVRVWLTPEGTRTVLLVDGRAEGAGTALTSGQLDELRELLDAAEAGAWG